MIDKKLKKEIWELIESEKPGFSDEIGWGSMDSLCDNIIKQVLEEQKADIKNKLLHIPKVWYTWDEKKQEGYMSFRDRAVRILNKLK